jgi:DNA-binding NarL/FixJ family response regulator
MPDIQVVCVDDNADLLATLQFLIDHSPGLSCSGILESADNLSAAVGDLHADVVVLDLGIPGCDCLEELREVRREHAGMKVIVFSGDSDSGTVEECMAAGAAACVVKSADPMELLERIREVAAG